MVAAGGGFWGVGGASGMGHGWGKSGRGEAIVRRPISPYPDDQKTALIGSSWAGYPRLKVVALWPTIAVLTFEHCIPRSAGDSVEGSGVEARMLVLGRPKNNPKNMVGFVIPTINTNLHSFLLCAAKRAPGQGSGAVDDREADNSNPRGLSSPRLREGGSR